MKTSYKVTYAQAVHDDEEKQAVIDVLDSHETILGHRTKKFEDQVAKLFGKRYGIMVNSGSSANFLAVHILSLPAGSEVITPILTFATTVAPLVQHNLIPVFVDAELGTYQINIDQIERSITKKTRLLMIPSLLGNIPNLQKLRALADRYNLIYIEDSCDTIGATFNSMPTGHYSDVSTSSFYGSHIITAGGGGGILCVNDTQHDRQARILRGWGRSSAVTESDSIDDRFDDTALGIPYDNKYIFETIGYNFLPMELGSAFGLVQLKKLPAFAKRRQRVFSELIKFFKPYEELFVLPWTLPEVSTAWLAFPITIKKGAPFTRLEFAKYLEQNAIQTRPLFSGNILRHPGFKSIPMRKDPAGYPVTDHIMEHSILLAAHHGLSDEQLDYMKEVIKKFIKKNV